MVKKQYQFRVLMFVRLTVVAMLSWAGLVQMAHATIISRDVGVTLNANNIESYNLDVDLNGTTDFTFTAALVLDPVVSVGFDVVDFPFGGSNGVVIDFPTINGFPTASRLQLGDTISTANIFSLASFDQGNLFFFTTFDPPSGNFEGQSGFLGLRFDRPDGVVFGFAEITVNELAAENNPLGLTIGRVGYNNVPGESIQINSVPEPASLMLFGFGALALILFRDRKRRPRQSSTLVSLSPT